MLGLSPVHLLIASVVAVLLLHHRLPPHRPLWAWLREHFPRWRFGTRDLLIATTVVAVVLGLIVWAVR